MKLLLVISVMLALLHTANGQCDEVENCGQCTNPDIECQSCAPGSVLSNDKKNCLDCSDRCMECILDPATEGATTCIKCSSGYLSEGMCTACSLDNCLLCSLVDDVEMCDVCVDPGYSISSEGACTGCAEDEYIDAGKCKSCATNAVKCASGGTVILCKDSGVKYVKDVTNKKCLSCDSSCVKCGLNEAGDASVCTECKANQYLTEDGLCEFCSTDGNGISICKTCAEESCEECSIKYKLVEEVCKQCDYNCDVCDPNDEDVLTCSDCSEEYGLNENIICSACSSNCVTCSNANTCSACAPGYYVSAGKCTACPIRCGGTGGTCDINAPRCRGSTNCDGVANCALCDIDGTEVTCTRCNNGYIANSAGVCLSCTAAATSGLDNCANCSAANATHVTCDTCDEDYFLNSTATECYACSTIDTNCLTCNDTGHCLTCNDGYLAEGTSCHDCTTVLAPATKCAECAYDADAGVKCSKCESGYGLDEDGACQSCSSTTTGAVANCAECEVVGDATSANISVATCTKCDVGYGVLGGSSCVNCKTATNGGDAKCTACTPSGADTVVCDTCDGNQTPIGGKCKDCPTNCVNCGSDSATCMTCKDGYTQRYNGAGAFLSCSKCPDNCARCSSTTANVVTCSPCVDHYILADDGTCEACPENCDTCSTSECLTCLTNFGKDENGNCIACIANCDDCDWDGTKQECTDCSTKYFLNNDQCTKCPANCIDCTYNGGVMDCDKCKDSYVLADGACGKCPNKCNECSSTTKCINGKCSSGYGVSDDGSCVDCATLTGIPNCANCQEKADSNGTAKCLLCFTGYTLKDELQYGEDAECVSVAELDCGVGGVIADKDFQCDEGQCTGDLIMTEDYLCGRRCHVCGNIAEDSYVPNADCKTENSTGEITILCPSGYCFMKSIKDAAGVVRVTAGCYPEDAECKEDDPCYTASGEENCEQCCNNEHLCTKNGLDNGLKNGGPHVVSVNVALLLVSSVLATMLLRVANN